MLSAIHSTIDSSSFCAEENTPLYSSERVKEEKEEKEENKQ
jgi:hypothetical protein